MIKLIFTDNWCGGGFEPSLDSIASIYLNGEEIDFTESEIHGEDYDHGHVYKWTAGDLSLKIETVYGLTIDKSLREMINKHDFYVRLKK